jgi:osmoprotectant transport system permease protein
VIVADAFTPGTFVDAFRFIGDNSSLILTKVGEQLGLSASAIGVSLALALPLGVWLGHLHRGSFLTINVSNVGRALPSLAVVALGLTFLPIGFWDVLVALVVLALPPMLTNAYVAVDEVDAEVVEAARAMGMASWQVLLRVELPLALPLIFAGIRTATVYVVSTATLAGIAGGGGLGDILFNQASYQLAGVVGAAYCVSALALGADLAFGALQFAVTPRALRRPGKALEPDVVTGVVAVEQ